MMTVSAGRVKQLGVNRTVQSGWSVPLAQRIEAVTIAEQGCLPAGCCSVTVPQSEERDSFVKGESRLLTAASEWVARTFD